MKRRKYIRRLRWILLSALAGIWLQCQSVHRAYTPSRTLHYRLGDTDLRLIRYDFDTLPILWFNMHDDENTAVRAARRSIRHGTLWEIRHGGRRNIRFDLHGRRYAFDPNRIYTARGRRQTLASLSEWTPEADAEVAALAHFITDSLLKGARVVVALHNNTAGDYAVTSYMPGGKYATDAAATHLSPGTDPDDFYYCADTAVYRALARAGYNALLQNDSTVTDDGSLSVFCGRRDIRYINIEAQRGHRRRQMEMIRVLEKILTGEYSGEN